MIMIKLAILIFTLFFIELILSTEKNRLFGLKLYNYINKALCHLMFIVRECILEFIYRGQQRLDFYFRTALKGEEFVF